MKANVQSFLFAAYRVRLEQKDYQHKLHSVHECMLYVYVWVCGYAAMCLCACKILIWHTTLWNHAYNGRQICYVVQMLTEKLCVELNVAIFSFFFFCHLYFVCADFLLPFMSVWRKKRRKHNSMCFVCIAIGTSSYCHWFMLVEIGLTFARIFGTIHVDMCLCSIVNTAPRKNVTFYSKRNGMWACVWVHVFPS